MLIIFCKYFAHKEYCDARNQLCYHNCKQDPGNEVQDLIGSTINEKRHVQQEQENISKSRLNKSSDLKECRSANACEVFE